MKYSICTLLSTLILGVFSCKDAPEKEEPYSQPVFPVQISFQHQVNGSTLELGDGEYTSPLGDEYKVQEFKYFVSNIELVRADGSVYVIPQDSSYFLINEKKPESKIIQFNAPQGEYVSIKYLIGVDSLRNTMDISKRQGVLDPAGEALGMYWGWNSGYIHFVIEGFSESIPVELSGTQKFIYHVGGFGGYSTPTINNIKSVELSLADKGTLIVSDAKVSNITVAADVNYIFKNKITGADMDFKLAPTFMFDRESMALADNYQHIFSHISTEN